MPEHSPTHHPSSRLQAASSKAQTRRTRPCRVLAPTMQQLPSPARRPTSRLARRRRQRRRRKSRRGLLPARRLRHSSRGSSSRSTSSSRHSRSGRRRRRRSRMAGRRHRHSSRASSSRARSGPRRRRRRRRLPPAALTSLAARAVVALSRWAGYRCITAIATHGLRTTFLLCAFLTVHCYAETRDLQLCAFIGLTL